MEIALFQTLASAMKAGWGTFARWLCSAQTLNVAVMANANSDHAIVIRAGKGTFAIKNLRSVGTVPQVRNVIAQLVFACVACHPARGQRRRATRAGAVRKTVKKVRMTEALTSWETSQAQHKQRRWRKRGKMPRMSTWRGIATRRMVTGTQRLTSVIVMASGMVSTVSSSIALDSMRPKELLIALDMACA
jgi:hypothetical protein